MLEDVLKTLDVDEELVQEVNYYTFINYKTEDLDTWVKYLDEKGYRYPSNIYKYGKEFDKNTDNYLSRISKSNFVRYYIKDISKKFGAKSISQTLAKKVLSGILADIVSNASCESYHSLFSMSTLDKLYDCINDELKDEFDQYFTLIITPLLESKKNLEMMANGRISAFYLVDIGKYFAEYLKDEPDTARQEELKEDMKSLLPKSENEIHTMSVEKVNKDIEKVENYIKHIEENYSNKEPIAYFAEIKGLANNDLNALNQAMEQEKTSEE